MNEQHDGPVLCADCGIDVMPDSPLGSADWQRYMVHQSVWAAAGIPSDHGWLCIACLETRLGRQLTAADFPAWLPINCPMRDDDLPRLAALKRETATTAGLDPRRPYYEQLDALKRLAAEADQ